MGSPISPVIANIFREHFEKELLRKTLKKTRSSISLCRRHIRDMEAEPNSVNSLFSSTINIQISISLWTQRKAENSPSQMFLFLRKLTVPQVIKLQKTNTDRYLHATTTHKNCNQFISILYRVFTSSDKEHLQIEFNHLKILLQKNGHDKKDIIKTINKHANKTTVFDTQSDERILSILPYVKGTTDRIGRILNKHNIQTSISLNHPKRQEILRNPKDQRPPHSASQVYKISCSCGLVYIGKTGRMVNLWIKEHQRDVRLKHVTQSALSEHNIETGHQILFDKTTIIANITSYLPRKYREAIEIQKHNLTI